MAERTDNPEIGPHLDDVKRMMYVDGELPLAEAEQLQAHLRVCQECRQSCSDLEEANQAYTEFHEQYSRSLPHPPRNWMDFEQRLQKTLKESEVLDQSVEGRFPGSPASWRSRLSVAVASFDFPTILPWALSGVAASIVLVFFLSHSAGKQPLSAKEVLSRAGQHGAGVNATTMPVVYQKIRITDSAAPQEAVTVQIWSDLTHRRFREEAVSGAAVGQDAVVRTQTVKTGQPPLLRDLKAAYAANHLPWNTPVSPEVYSDWTRSLERKEESVTEEHLASGQAAYRISAKVVGADSAATPDNPFLRTMELLVRATDWHVVAERMTIANRSGVHTYEIAELEYRVLPFSQFPTDVSDHSLGSSEAISDAGSLAPQGRSSSSSADLAVEVLDRLDRVDALVQDQIVVTRAGSEGLQIGGTVRSESRKAEILNALGSLATHPAIKLQLLSDADARAVETTPLSHPIQMQAVEVMLNESSGPPEVRAYLSLHRHMSKSDLDQATNRFVAEAVSHSTEAQLHAQTLKHILEIVPDTATGLVYPETSEKWRTLVNRHTQAVRREVHLLEELLSPVFSHADPASGALARGTAVESGMLNTSDRLLNTTTDSDQLLWNTLSSNANSADRRGLTDARFWTMLKEEDLLATQLSERADP